MRKLHLAAALLAVLVCAGVHAQQYPARSIRFISPFPPGGGNDTLSRIVADKLGEQIGHRIIVDNRPGASTIVGTEALAKSAPDGYTVALLPNTFSTNPSFYPKLPYDTLKDFTAIGQVAQSPQMLVVHPSLPARTLKELLALAKSKPGQLSYGTSGNGSVGHLGMMLLTAMSGVPFVHVPYKGTAASMNDVIGGHIPLMMSSMLSTLPQVRAGKLRIIAITTAQRAKVIPDVPTIAEAGVPGYDATLWYGFVAPARVPDAIVRKLNSDLAVVLKSPDVIEKLSNQAVDPFHTSPEQFAALIRTEYEKWAKIIKAGGIKSD